jgi:hypothetical protein
MARSFRNLKAQVLGPVDFRNRTAHSNQTLYLLIANGVHGRKLPSHTKLGTYKILIANEFHSSRMAFCTSNPYFEAPGSPATQLRQGGASDIMKTLHSRIPRKSWTR